MSRLKHIKRAVSIQVIVKARRLIKHQGGEYRQDKKRSRTEPWDTITLGKGEEWQM